MVLVAKALSLKAGETGTGCLCGVGAREVSELKVHIEVSIPGEATLPAKSRLSSAHPMGPA